ncbi:hypothetical protein, partial [Frankia sp. CpI1-P]
MLVGAVLLLFPMILLARVEARLAGGTVVS